MNAVEPFSFRHPTGAPLIEVTAEHIENARKLIEEGWCQTSRKHRMLARLPDGKTGVEALADAERRYGHQPDPVKWATGLGNGGAGSFYLSRYAHHDLNNCTVDLPTFSAFKKLGGTTYYHWYYETYKRKSA